VTALMDWESMLVRVLRAPDPLAALDLAATDPAVPAELRVALAGLDRDGVAVAAKLVARQRFERLLRGDAEAGAWSRADPAAFAATFRVYHTVTPATAFGPAEEAALWRRFLG
jgi:hypothetical protein